MNGGKLSADGLVDDGCIAILLAFAQASEKRIGCGLAVVGLTGFLSMSSTSIDLSLLSKCRFSVTVESNGFSFTLYF